MARGRLEQILGVLSMSLFLPCSDANASDFQTVRRERTSLNGTNVTVNYIRQDPLEDNGLISFSRDGEIYLDKLSLEDRARMIYRNSDRIMERVEVLRDLYVDELFPEQSDILSLAIYANIYRERINSLSEQEFVNHFCGTVSSGQIGKIISHESNHISHEMTAKEELRATLQPFADGIVESRICLADALAMVNSDDEHGEAAREIIFEYTGHISRRVSDLLSLREEDARKINFLVYNSFFSFQEQQEQAIVEAVNDHNYSYPDLHEGESPGLIENAMTYGAPGQFQSFIPTNDRSFIRANSRSFIPTDGSFISRVRSRSQVHGYDPEELIREVAAASQEYGISEDLIYSVMWEESRFNPRAISRQRARGLMQIMGFNFQSLEISDPYDISQSIRGGARYLRRMLNRFDGNVPLALAAYNAGPLSVERHNGVPPYRETREYVDKVLAGCGILVQ